GPRSPRVPRPPVGRLIGTLRSEGTIRKGLGTAFTRPVEIPDAIVDAVRDMTHPRAPPAPPTSLRGTAPPGPPRRPRRPSAQDLWPRGPAVAVAVGGGLSRRSERPGRTAAGRR